MTDGRHLRLTAILVALALALAGVVAVALWSRDEAEPQGGIAFNGWVGFPARTLSDIFVVNADGTGVAKLAQGSQPAWSPDGGRLVFADGLGRGLRLANADGAGVVKLTSCRAPFCEGHQEPAWSPDGERVAFVVQLRPTGNPTGKISVRLFQVTVQSRRVVELLSCPRTGCDFSNPAWSPDGRELAFWESRWDGERWVPTLRVLELATGGVRTLHECPGCGSIGGPSWSPDSTRMVIDRGRDLYLIDPRTGALDQVTDCGPGADCLIDEYPAWSPDADWIAFARLVREGTPLGLFLVRPDGSDLRPLGVRGLVPAWQPTASSP